MLKTLLSFVLLFSFVSAQDSIKLQSAYFTTENDADFRQDNDYTYGSELAVLFSIDANSSQKLQFISFSYAHKMYTPKDLQNKELIIDDRPYAGFEYIKVGYYLVASKTLTSNTIQLGRIGPSTHMENVQKFIHSLIGSKDPNGWQHQLHDEYIFQWNFSKKQLLTLSQTSVWIPQYGVELGNASTKAYLGATYRWGKNIPKNFGASMIDNANFTNIPLSLNKTFSKEWQWTLNLSTQLNYIYRDIFLDGNSDGEGHSVEKYNFLLEVGYGISFVYDRWSFDYLRKHTSKEFTTQNRYHNYGSLIFGYSF